MNDSERAEKHKAALLEKYRRVGVKPGDTVFLHAQLFAFKKLSDDKDEFVRIFLDPLMKAVDYPRGTVAALTFTTSYSSFGKPYVHEKSPSEAGLLTEYIRTLPGAVRSFHPIGSVSAVGKHKKNICEKVSRSQFGWNSVYHRMHQLKGKGLYIGMTLGETCTFMHYVEHLFGVSHCYHKAFFYPAYYRGVLRKGPFLGFLRNRKSKPYDFRRFEKHMKKLQKVSTARYRGAPIQLVTFEDCFNEGMKLLEKDPCYFIEQPFYVTE